MTQSVLSSQSLSCVPASQICTQISVSLQGVAGLRSSSYWPVLKQDAHKAEPTAAYVPIVQSTHAVVLSSSVSA